MRKTRTWALVIDGVKARILRGILDGRSPAEAPAELVNKSRHGHLRRTFEAGHTHHTSASASRDCKSEAIRSDMEEFAIYVCSFLDSHRLARDFDQLAILATPIMLDLLKQKMRPPLRRTVYFECAASLVHLSESDLRQKVAEILSTSPKSQLA
ncbi:host attachment protein [Marimonas lutisalis]|uniref:host attachment protein n=1 Tax=Marimonas lutisalis TaxID=2545756 RepID=UPI001375E894|nr:host attachment protein [Marimonas lutisalis]